MVKKENDCVEKKKYIDTQPSPSIEPGKPEVFKKVNTSSENTTPEMKNQKRKPSDKAIKIIGKRLKAEAF
jgi:hypothetical protein